MISPSRSMISTTQVVDLVERVGVDVHRRAEADRAAVLSERGEQLGVVVERRLVAGASEALLERERARVERRALGLAAPVVSGGASGSGSPRSRRVSRASRSRADRAAAGRGSSTTPPPSVSGGARLRITSRSPAAGTIGSSSRSWKNRPPSSTSRAADSRVP